LLVSNVPADKVNVLLSVSVVVLPPTLKVCPDLFTVTAYNKIVFCNGSEGGFIDHYDSKQMVFEELQARIAKLRPFHPACTKRVKRSVYSDEHMLRYAVRRAIAKKTRQRYPNYPARIFCFPTYHCNNDCQHCFAGDKAKRKGLSLAEAKSLVKNNAQDYRCLHIAGGEPTLFKDLILKSKKTLSTKISIPLGQADPVMIHRKISEYLPEKEEKKSLIDLFAKILGI